VWLEADRMAYPLAHLDEAGFAQERDVVKNEWRQHYEDVPLGDLDSFAREAIYGSAHPYGTRTIGNAEELDKTSLAEARAFARAYYRPNNATLVVAGLFDVAATRELVKRYFGTIPAGPPPPIRTMPPPMLERSQRIDVEAAVDGPAVMVAWPAPATHGDGMEELGYGFGFFAGRVRRRLVTEKKIANDVDTSYQHSRLGGVASVLVKLKPGESPDTTLSVIDEYLAEASRLGRQWSFDGFANYKTRALVSEIGTMEGLEGRAQRILHDIELHGAPNSMKQDLQKLQRVDAADVGAAVEHFLIDGRRVVIVVKPNPSAPRAGRKVPR
jgi:zinc protease